MLNFKKLTLQDMPWARDILYNSGNFGCEYTFGGAIVWSSYFDSFTARFEDFIIYRCIRTDHAGYSYPCGKGDIKKAFEEIFADAKALGKPPMIFGMTHELTGQLDSLFPDRFEFSPNENSLDYIYKTNDLAQLPGKKYHAKRNHVSAFLRSHQNWGFEIIGRENIDECIEMLECWYKENAGKANIEDEKKALFHGLSIYFEVGFSGGILRSDGQIIALTFGEPINDRIFDIHFEKALDINGAYAMINQQFAKNCLGAYEYINREEDLGIEGLRKAKLSYRPAILLEKFHAMTKSELS